MEHSPIDAELQKLKASHEQAQARLVFLTRIGNILTILVVLVVVGYLTALFSNVKSMYAMENFEQPVAREVQNLLPKLEPELRTLWAETAPVYGELALNKFEEALPAIQEASHRELEALTSGLLVNAQQQIDRSLDRVARKHNEALIQRFPRLASESGADEMGMRWMETIEGDFEKILLHFNDRYVKDLGLLQSTLEQFRSEELERMSEDELMRQFVHLWLMKVDRMVMLQDENDGSGEGAHHAN